MKKLAAICAATLLASVLFVFLPTISDAGIFRQTMRLHVVANSDSDADQELKLLVRDRITAELEKMFCGLTDISAAEDVVIENFDFILAAVHQVLAEAGAEYSATLEVDSIFFPTMVYEDVAFPAGRYRAVVVHLGEAVGENWWCVLFPPLCLAAASADRAPNTQRLAEAGFTPDQVRIVTQNEDSPRFVVRFRLLELFGGRN